MITDLDDITFWAINTKSTEEILKNNEDTITNGMSETEKKAYLLGAENAFSLFNQLMTDGISRDSIMFYNPEVETETEFSSDEVAEWLSKQSYL